MDGLLSHAPLALGIDIRQYLCTRQGLQLHYFHSEITIVRVIIVPLTLYIFLYEHFEKLSGSVYKIFMLIMHIHVNTV